MTQAFRIKVSLVSIDGLFRLCVFFKIHGLNFEKKYNKFLRFAQNGQREV